MIRLASLAIAVFFCFGTSVWENDLDAAKQEAAKDNKYILLNFSGSDWCGPCIRLHKEIFDSQVFTAFATKNLILVNADFPRQKKNQLSKEQQGRNNKMADQYNAQGSFPYTVLLDPQGKIIRSWDGFPGLSPEEFVAQLRARVPEHN
jgi:thioredoxin-related protein